MCVRGPSYHIYPQSQQKSKSYGKREDTIMARRCLFNPCRGRGLRFFLTLFTLLQCLFISVVFVLYNGSETINIENCRRGNKTQTVNNTYMNNGIQLLQNQGNAGLPTNKPLSTKKPSVDMVNDYVPYVDFKFVYPEIQPRIDEDSHFYLVILVNSGAQGNIYRQRRAKIRETWASKNTCEYSNTMNNTKLKDRKWILVFVLGKTRGADDQLNIEEAKKYNDMIIGNITDNYLNNILKFYMGQIWASFLGTKYTLKTDDDVYVRIPKVIEYLISKGSPSHYYGGGTYHGSVVVRSPGGKWSVSKKYFAEDVFPPFNAGAFILLSTDLVGELINYVHSRKPFHTDDAYIGVAMRDLKVKVVHILSFVIENNMGALVHSKDNCYIFKVLAYGHSVKPRNMEHVHKRVEELCHKKSTLKTLKCT